MEEELAKQRVHIHQRWPEYIALGAFSATVACAIPFHEPWADEAQAWQLARSLSLPALFIKYVRYEGSPGLWHFLLWTLNRLHVSYSALHWICGGIAVIAASFLIFRSPLPRYLKLALPFTYFLVFQYAVIARSYVLVPLLLFMIANWWEKGPVRIALMLGLLANVSLHAAVISGGLAILYSIEQWRQREGWKSTVWQKLCPALLLLAFYAFAVWTTWPPHDLPISKVEGGIQSFLLHSLVSLLWGICQFWFVSVLFWVGISICFRGRKSLLYLLPVLLFALFSGMIPSSLWHMGLLIPLVICLLWITRPAIKSHPPRSEVNGHVALVLVIIVQIFWTAHAIAYDHTHAYSPDLAAAQFLKPMVDKGKTISVTYIGDARTRAYYSMGLMPYFEQPIFINQSDSFWWWSEQNSTESQFQELLPSHPDVVLLEIRDTQPDFPIPFEHPKVKSLIDSGYQLTNLFCGTMPARMESDLTACHLIFQNPHRTNLTAAASSDNSKTTR